jgi:general secretion pathway protein D
MQETFSMSDSQVPLLGDIPLLGNLFKYRSVSRKKTNLLLFLTPHIIKEPKDLADVSEKQQKKMDTFVEQNKGEAEGVLPP